MKEIVQTLEQKPQLKELMIELMETLDILKREKSQEERAECVHKFLETHNVSAKTREVLTIFAMA